MTALLDVTGLTKTFGGLTAVDRVSFSLRDGEILGIVGPNGSGKSTLINLLSGVYVPDAGRIALAGRDLAGLAPHAIAVAGMARTFQNLQIFAGLTVGENVLVGHHCRMRAGVFASVFASPGFRREERASRALARHLLDAVGLGGTIDDSPASLSYGQRRLLEVARALATEPRVLMLDEPCAGLSQSEADALASFLRTLGGTPAGTAVIVIEHNMRFVMALVDRIVALNFGRTIGEGTPAEIRANPAVISAYLGKARDA